MINTEQCDLCVKKAAYSIRRIKTNQWLTVCKSHDSFIGIENLIALGENPVEAKKINKEVKAND